MSLCFNPTLLLRHSYLKSRFFSSSTYIDNHIFKPPFFPIANMKFTAITAAFVIAFASAQKSGAAPPEVSGVPSFAAHPTGVFTPGASGFAHPSGHHKHPHHRPSGFSGFAFPTGVWPTGFPHHHPSGHRSSHGPYMPVPIKTAPAGAAPTGTVQRRQEMSGVPEVPSGVPSGFPSGVAHTGT